MSCTVSTSDLAGSSGALGNSFAGCVTGAGLTNSSVEITFAFPDGADKVVVSRNGVEIGSSSSSSTTAIIDTGLVEGTTYHYTCDAFRGARKIEGVNELDVAPVNTNAPVFAGIKTASATSPSSASATVTWNPEGDGPKVSYFKVFANLGSTVDWNATPVKTVTAKGVFSTTHTGMGDEIPYAFGIRACTAQNICDSNTVVKTVTLGNSGAPLTVGATAVTAANFTASITAPWSADKGGIAERRIYQCIGTGCTIGTAPSKIVSVTDITKPPTTLTVENLNEYMSYSFKVLDVDPSGNISSNNSIITIQTGDLSAPSFAGITSVSLNTSAPDTKVDINFLALAREGTTDSGAINGASQYLLYVTSAAFPAAAADACAAVSPRVTLAASLYAPGMATYTLTNLNPRTNYGFCLKARDAAGNTSTNTISNALTTSDITAPTFGGIQSLTFNSNTRKIQLAWNTSSSTDLRIYRVKMWSNTTTPTDAQITTFNLSGSGYPSGHSFTLTDYPANGLDTIYGVVDACDNALDLNISGQGDNCTAFTLSSAKMVTLPDITPPQNFPGIRPEAFQTTPLQGQAVISWYPATTWSSDYQGFKVYSVDSTNSNALTLLKTCVCATPGSCNNSDVSCTLTGLSPSRTYRFHVRAFDLAGNETEYLNPATNYADLKILDTTAPVFSSGLSIAQMTLTWTAATDNQYAQTGNVITYKVYRKVGTTFTLGSAPYNDGTLVSSQTTTSYSDDNVGSGGTFFYAVCAVDAQNNRTCDGNVKSAVVTDGQKPTILTYNQTKSNENLKKWGLNWTVSDNVSANANLRIRIYRKYGTTPDTSATTADEKILDSYGDGSLGDLRGPLNVNNYISYMLWVQDEAGNITTSVKTIYSPNVITITSVASSQGSISGGRILLIKGTGFSTNVDNGFTASTVVKLGSATCLNTVILSSKQISCVTPAAPEATVAVTVTNPEGSAATLANAYAYLGSSTDICDNSSSWGASFAKGSGSPGDPFVICNRAHLVNALNSTVTEGGYSFKLGDNIDLSSSAFAMTTKYFIGTFDGAGFAIMNNNLANTATDLGLLFMQLAPHESVTIKNLNLLNFTFTHNYPTAVANTNIFASFFYQGMSGGSVSFDSITATGKFTAPSASSASFGFFSSYSQWNSFGSYTISMVNSDITLAASGGIQRYATLFVSPPVGTYVTTPTFNVSSSKFSGTVTSTYSVLEAAGLTAGGLKTATQNFNSCDVALTASANASTTVGTVGGLSSTAGAIFQATKSKANLNVSNFASGNFGGFIAANVNFVTPANSTPAKSITINDSYVLGSILPTGGSRGVFGAGWGYDSTTGSGMSLSRIWGAVSIFASGTRYSSVPLQSYSGTTPSAYSPGTTSGVFYNSDLLSSISTAPANSTLLSSTQLTTAGMQSQSSTGIFPSSGYDFTPTTGIWKWCAAGDYPHLMWETCP